MAWLLHAVHTGRCHTSLGSDGSVTPTLPPPTNTHTLTHTAGPVSSRNIPAAWTRALTLADVLCEWKVYWFELTAFYCHFIPGQLVNTAPLIFATFDHIGVDRLTPKQIGLFS